MPYCPKCKNEYYEGFTVCADCKVDLVATLEEAEKLGAAYSEEEVNGYVPEEFLEEELITETPQMIDFDSLSDEQKLELKQMMEEQAKEQAKKAHGGSVYQNYAEKAAENKSSAFSLLAIGIIGLAALAMSLAGVFDLPFHSETRYIMIGVLGFLFGVFTVMGVVSIKNARKYSQQADKEEALTEEMRKWCESNLSGEKIDAEIFDADELALSSELKFFKRNEKVKELIAERFEGLDDAFLSRFADEIFSGIFPE